jgi:hypothetical protein
LAKPRNEIGWLGRPGERIAVHAASRTHEILGWRGQSGAQRERASFPQYRPIDFSALAESVREVDLVGWYRQDCVLMNRGIK